MSGSNTWRIVYEYNYPCDGYVKYFRNEFGLFCSSGRSLRKWSDDKGWLDLIRFNEDTTIDEINTIALKLFGRTL